MLGVVRRKGRLTPSVCILAPLVFNIFFAVLLRVVVQRFVEDPEILADLLHPHEQATEGAT